MEHPEEIDGYRVLQFLGRGGMGLVYRVACADPPGEEALKIFRPSLGATDLDRLRFGREFRLASRLVHPGLVRVHRSGVYQDCPYFTMEYLPGPNLRDHLRALRQEMSLREWLASLGSLVDRILEGLAYIHSQGIIHRDLKPENILIGGDGTPRLLDFGLARLQEESMSLTSAGTVVGTVHYMSPEQISGHEVDPRSDLYSLGVVLYEVLAGRLPFEAADLMSVLTRILTTQPPPLWELAGPLPPALTALVERLLRKEPSERFVSAHETLAAWREIFGGQRAPPSVSPPASPRPGLARTFEPRFVGRSHEMRRLHEVLAEAGRGRGRVVLVQAAAGLGKSRLLREAVGRARASGWTAAWGQASEVESLPYQLWIPVLQKLCSEPLASELETFRGLLAVLLPELGPPVSQGLDQPLQRYRLFEGTARLVRAQAARQPLLICLEDLHWADGGSLELFHYLARQMAAWEPSQGPARLMILATAREEESEGQARRVLESLDRLGILSRLPLPPLGEPQVEEMARSMLGTGNLDSETADKLFRETEGNPLFVGEILKAFLNEDRLRLERGFWRLERGTLSRTSAGGTRIPVTVREVVERRLRAISELELKVARMAAVLGRFFDFEVLARALEIPREELLDRLENLLTRRVIEESPGHERGRFAFCHQQIYEVVLESIPDAERRLFHERAARALEAVAPGERSAFDLVRHYQACGRDDLAAAHLVKAAEAAARAFSYHDAARLYRAAWELPQADQVLPRAELRERLADATMFSGDVEQALEIYTWLQQESSPGLVRGRLFRKLAQCWAALGDFPQAQRCTLQGLEELGVRPTGRGLAGAVRSALSLVGLLTPSLSARSYQADLPRTRELVLLSHHLAFVQFLARPPGWMVDAIDITARQILAARALGEGEPAARAKVVLGFVLTSAGAATRGLGVRVLQSAAEAALVPPPSAERALILRETGYLLHLAGQPHEALRRCRQAVEMSHHLGDVQGLAETYVVLAPALLHLGRPGEAVEAGRRAVDYAQMISSRTNEMIARFDLAWAEAVRGRPAAARRHLEQAARVLGKPMPLFLDSVYRLAQGWVASAEGRAAEALPPALQARRDWKRIGGGDYLWLHFLALEGELRLGATDQEPGRRAEHLQALQGVVRKLWTRGKGRPLMEGLAWRLEGERLRHQGRPQEARRALEKALALFEGLGSPLERARTHLSLARLLAAQEAEAARLHRDKATLLMVEAGCPEDYIGVVMAQIQPGEQP